MYVVGISWYLSAMFLALAILYPLCYRFRSNFTLTICPVAVLLIYGFLSHRYGHIAVASDYTEGILINVGLLRGLAGCMSGVLLYELCKRFSDKTPTKVGRIIFSVLEISGAFYLFYAMHMLAKSQYDYVCVFLTFVLLFIGISGYSIAAKYWKSKNTKCLGEWSTLIVLNHCCWRDYLPQVLGAGYTTTSKVWIYYAAVLASCIIVLYFSKKIRKIIQQGVGIELFDV